MDFRTDIDRAQRRISRFVRETPLEFSHYLSGVTGCEVYLKLENYQFTGSFKVRGAFNKLLCLEHEAKGEPVVAASTGNHGLGVAYASNVLGTKAIIYLPNDVAPCQAEAIASYGAIVKRSGDNCLEAEVAARRYAEASGLTYISPYNDTEVIAGQGTIAAELVRQAQNIDAIFVALGGGGLISGVGGYLKAVATGVDVIACSPENSPVMHQFIRAGQVGALDEVAVKPTLSHSTAGLVEKDSVTLKYCREAVDDALLISEREIMTAIRVFIEQHHMLIEGAAGLAVGGLCRVAQRYKDRSVVILVCGANIGRQELCQVLDCAGPSDGRATAEPALIREGR